MIIIKTEKLSKNININNNNLVILNKINLEIKSGSSVALLGVSGSGKTTLLCLLAGLDLPSNGVVYLNGVNLNKLNEDQRAILRANNIGFIFQNFQLLSSLTALENVSLPLELANNKNAKKIAVDFLEQVGLKDRITHYPNQLSGGEQQRVAIARAFAVAPKILFADEPTGNLDQKTGAIIKKLLFDLNSKYNTTLVIATHDISLAERCEINLHLEAGMLQDK